MKKYKLGIVLGIISIITSLLFTGVPVAFSNLPLINIIVFILGLLGLIAMYLKAEDKHLLIYIISYLVITFTLTAIIETSDIEYTLLLLGWLPGLIIGIVGLLRSIKNKEIYNIKIAKILCIIGMALSVINLVGGLITYKGFLIVL